MFAREVTEREEEELKKAISSSSAFTRDIARIILFSLNGESCKQIAEKLGCDQRKVRKAIKAFNEKGRTPVKQYGGMKWESNKHYRISYNQKVKGLFDIFAVKNIHSRERHYRYYDWKNSFIVIDFIEWLSTNVYPDKEIYLILDNWSAHRSNAFDAYVDLHPRIHPVYLPTTASWMNDIERDYSRVQKEVLNNSNFDSPKEAMSMISSFFENILNSS